MIQVGFLRELSSQEKFKMLLKERFMNGYIGIFVILNQFLMSGLVPISSFLNTGKPWPLFDLLSLFNTNLVASWIKTRIVRVEGEDTDH